VVTELQPADEVCDAEGSKNMINEADFPGIKTTLAAI